MSGNIAKIVKLEDCFDGSSIFQYWFERVLESDSIHLLGSLGQLEYFPHFPRPFFRITTPQGLQVKGVEGQDHIRAIFPRENKEQIKSDFESFLMDQYHPGFPGETTTEERRK